MSQPKRSAPVTDLSVARAQQLLRDMQEHQFCVLIFKGDHTVKGYSTVEDADTLQLIQAIIEAV